MSHDPALKDKPLDAGRTLVDRAPPWLEPWLRLGRFDRPAGVWLLFWPGAWGIALGAAMDDDVRYWPEPELLALFFIGAVVMRAAGCVWNDVLDKDLDAKVARTAARPIAAGKISRAAGVAFACALSLVGFLILIQLNAFAIILGVLSLGLVAAYPLMKRVTWWPQAWLGLTFNWGALMGFAAASGQFSAAAGVLYLAGVFWTLGYDTVYACQDIEDDAMAGVKSSARALGDMGRVKAFSLFCYGLSGVCLALATPVGWLVDQRWTPNMIAFGPIFAGVLAATLWRADLTKPAQALAAFKIQQITGAAPFVFITLTTLFANWGA